MRQEQDGPEAGFGPARVHPTSMPPIGSGRPIETQRLQGREEPVETLLELEPEPSPGEGGGAYWTGLVFLVAGLIATIAGLATRVTSIVQTVVLAIPMVAIGFGLERVGRGIRRGSLRALGGALMVVAVASPVVLSVTAPRGGSSATVSAPVPASASQAQLRTNQGGGQLRIGSGAVGLYQAELRSPGAPVTQVSTSGKVAVVDLRSPTQRGLLARNRGSDWSIRLNPSVPWRIRVEAGSLTADLDLDQLDVRGVELESGISRLAVRLNQPTTRVPVNLQVSTGLIDVYVPRSAAVEIRVDGAALNNFSTQSLTQRDGAWRTIGQGSQSGSFQIQVRLTAGRVRLHRI